MYKSGNFLKCANKGSILLENKIVLPFFTISCTALFGLRHSYIRNTCFFKAVQGVPDEVLQSFLKSCGSISSLNWFLGPGMDCTQRAHQNAHLIDQKRKKK